MKNHLLIIVLLLPATLALGQNNYPALQQAFITSYEKEAEEAFDEAVAALTGVYQAQSYELNLRLGWLHYLQGDYFKSKEYYARAMAILPYSVEAKLGYVLPLAALGNQDEVIQTYEAVLKIDPKNSQANYWLGASLYLRGQYDLAYQHTELVVNMYPFDYDSVVLLAWIHLAMGNSSKAKALFQKALLNQPNSTSAREGLKLCE